MLPSQFDQPEPIGEGGFGAVWKATAPGGTKVAVKVPKMLDADTIGRFRREVKVQSEFDHANIVAILDFDLAATTPWCAMPLADENFESFVSEISNSPAEVLDALRQVMEGTRHAHEKHVIHRDLKPGNVLIFRQGGAVTARLADFGLSRIFTREDMTYQTAVGDGFVSQWFSAPEQFVEFSDVEVTADIFSVGRILEFCLIKRPDIELQHPGLGRCVEVATRHRPDERYQSMDQFVAAIEVGVTGPSAFLRPVQVVEALSNKILKFPDDERAVKELMNLIEQHAVNGQVLHGVFSKLPYEIFERLALEFPGQLRAVLRTYVESLVVHSGDISMVLPVDGAMRALRLFDHCLREVADRGLRAVALVGLVHLASIYEMPDISAVALGWLHTESDAVVIADVLRELQAHDEIRTWIKANAEAARLTPLIADEVFNG